MNALVQDQAIADQLWEAQEVGKPCPPLRDLLASDTPEHQTLRAYAIQQQNIQRQLLMGRRVVGRKIGLTSPAVQKQLGVDQPDFGTLLDDMAVVDGQMIDTTSLLQPKVEAEVALVLKRDLPHERHTVADIIAATDYALAAIEVVASRIAGWNIRFVDTVADNASSGLFVLGTTPIPLAHLDLPNARMQMTRDGQVVSEGVGAACLGNPLNAARWLADTMVRSSTPLRAGDVLMTGALGPMVAVEAGQTYIANIDGFPPVRAIFS